jgi:hypothetical protein
MKSDDTSMYDDPTTPQRVRDLLHAGRRANVDYDVERGLAKHLAAIANAPAGTLAPATIAAKTWPTWFGFVAMPLAAASVAGLLWVYSSDRPAPTTNGVGSSAATQAPSEVPVVPSAKAAPAAKPTTLDEVEVRAGDDGRPSWSERRRAGLRANAARSNRAGSNNRASGDGDLEGAAVATAAPSTEAQAIDARSFDGPSKRSASESSSTGTSSTPSTSSTSSADSRDRDTRSVQNPSNTPSQAHEVERAAVEEPAKAEERARPAGDAVKPAPVVDESRLEREMQMLAVTQRVLASDPSRALRLSEQGEREFAGSMFSAERRQLGLLALVKLGRLDEARRAGRPFLARYPKAPWSERLRRALATGVVE